MSENTLNLSGTLSGQSGLSGNISVSGSLSGSISTTGSGLSGSLSLVAASTDIQEATTLEIEEILQS